ncbi:hypothetical protein KAH55_09275 [bacterium]|nr:hypothetical protein [bacterium]
MGYNLSLSRTLSFVLIFGVLCGGLFDAGYTQVKFDKDFFSIYRVEDPALIDTLLTEFMLPKEAIKRIDFIDINENGPDDHDVIRLTPDGEVQASAFVGRSSQLTGYLVYSMSEIGVTESLRRRIRGWQLLKHPVEDVFSTLEDAREYHEETRTAKSSILVTMLTGLMQNYDKKDVKLMLHRLPNGNFKFLMVGFDETGATYNEPWDPEEMAEILISTGDGPQVAHELYQELKKQFESELVIVTKSRVDTVFVLERKAQGMNKKVP